jgi:hypothetical protein
MSLIKQEWADKSWVKQFSHDIDKLDKANNCNHILMSIVKSWLTNIGILLILAPIAWSYGHTYAAEISAAKEFECVRLVEKAHGIGVGKE